MSNAVTADYLFRKSNISQIKTEIDNLSKAIDDNILKSHNMGLSEIRYELPEHFSITNMTRKDAQLIIYSRLIERYEIQRGFRVSLIAPDNILLIQWTNIIDPNEQERMSNVLKSHMVLTEKK